jgi:class 3 adenylate cyclase
VPSTPTEPRNLVFGHLGPAFGRQPVERVVVEAPVLRGGRRVDQGEHPLEAGPHVATEGVCRNHELNPPIPGTRPFVWNIHVPIAFLSYRTSHRHLGDRRHGQVVIMAAEVSDEPSACPFVDNARRAKAVSRRWPSPALTGLSVDETLEFLTGAGPADEPNRVLATVLFTDIVDSTRQAVELGDKAWSALLYEHDTVAIREVVRHGGRVVKTTGDGILATFDGPARSVRCARAISQGVRTLGVEVRAGVHTSEVELRGGDVSGLGVSIASRIEALAGPSEVLVSRTVTDLVAGSGLEFTDRGPHNLKGIPGSWQLFLATG